ncbi:hypothetical protein M9458_007321, partial [Cirrhinus mrigala]
MQQVQHISSSKIQREETSQTAPARVLAARRFSGSGLLCRVGKKHTLGCTIPFCVAAAISPVRLSTQGSFLKELSRVDVFIKTQRLNMPFHPCASGCGHYLAPGDGHDCCLTCLGTKHAEAAFVDESCSHCGRMTIGELRTRLHFLQRGGVPVPLPRSSVPPGKRREGATSGGELASLTVTVRNSPKRKLPPSTSTSQPVERPKEQAGPSREVPLVSFGAPPDDRMMIAASEGEPDLSGEDDLSTLAPTRRSAMPDMDPEMMAKLARAAESVGLEWKPPSRPKPSLLDDWYLGVARTGSEGPTPVPFFPDVHDELTGTWMAPFTARNRSSGTSSLTTLDRGTAWGYTAVPPVERAVAMQLCPSAASAWRGNPLLPSRACRHSSALIGSAYAACGEAGSALHAIALLQVHQAKALKDLYGGGHGPEVLKEFRIATDLALRATKVTTQSLGRAMSTMVVQERHLWLCLANMRETNKIRLDQADAPVLHAEITTLLAKDAIEPVPPAGMRTGFYSPYFIVPKKGGGLRPILDLRVLNPALHRLPFKMLMQKHIFRCVRPQGWFAAIDLKDAYFHVSILPHHRPFLRYAFEVQAYQYKVLPFGLSLSPCVFTKLAEAALVPLKEQGIRILNYLDDWLILAQSRDQLCEHRDLVLAHLSRLGFRVNWEKSKLSPTQRISFLGMELDSVEQKACLTQERAQSMLNCLNTFKCRTAVPLKLFQRLLGHMAAAAAVTLLGLLHMRPLQHWLHGRVLKRAWLCGTHRVKVTPACHQTFTRGQTLRSSGQEHAVVHTDASTTGWGATYDGQAVSGHVLVRTDNAATIAHINRQGGLCSCRMSQLACLPPPLDLRLLRAIHIPGLHNRAANELLETPSPVGPADLETPVCLFRNVPLPVVLFPDRGNTRHGRTGRQLATGPAQTLCKIREDKEQVLLVAPYWPTRTWFLRGARRLNPPRPPSVPSWDLSLVLTALRQAPFEPLQSVELKFLSIKTLLLLALASIKRVGDLHAFSVDESCLEFGPADSQVTLRPRPGYVLKVPTTPFRDQVVSLHVLPPEAADPALALLCPVRALRWYVDQTQSFRASDQLFVCFGGWQKGNAVSKQRMAHWIVDAITLAYQAQGVPCQL